jgi:hypothetical protein
MRASQIHHIPQPIERLRDVDGEVEEVKVQSFPSCVVRAGRQTAPFVRSLFPPFSPGNDSSQYLIAIVAVELKHEQKCYCHVDTSLAPRNLRANVLTASVSSTFEEEC